MRQSKKAALEGSQPLVGIAVDGSSAYGRAIFRGVTRYANLQRRWLLHKGLQLDADVFANWPNCDGSIVAGLPDAQFALVKRRSRATFACTGSVDPSVCPVIALDDHAAGAMAAAHLLECGFEHFAYYGSARAPRPSVVAGKRLAGFRESLASRGRACHESSVVWPSGLDFFTHSHHPALFEWLRGLPRPVGILCSDDSVAHDLAVACLQAGLGVPDQVGIVGVNNDDILCESAWPPLTSIECDYSRMGYLAAKLLDQVLGGEPLRDDQRASYLPPLGVAQRQSTSLLATGDPDVVAALRYIRAHACDPCNVGDVLRRVPVGRRWLERQFVRQLGHTPNDEISRVRVETARRLLLQPDLRLPEIAERCGFSALQTFERAFTRAVGTRPAAYRRGAIRGRVP